MNDLPTAITRPPAVSGLFYPDDPVELRANIDGFIDRVSRRNRAPSPPVAMIVPHAGYIYSGAVAASAYAELRDWVSSYRRVVLIGPAHRVAFQGIALPDVEVFASPLAEMQLDLQAVQELLSLPFVAQNECAHAAEHSLEVQLPFLQTVLADVLLVPLLVGDCTAEMLDAALELVVDADTLVVVSSDLSHYQPYAVAQALDTETCASIVRGSPSIDHQHACGATAVNGLAIYAQRHHWSAELLDLRNSGDTAGSRDQVVGYASLVYRHG